MVWTFLPTPLARDVIDRIDPALTIYYCIDDLASSSPEARRIAAERAGDCSSRADLVFVTSEKLRAAGGAVQRSRCTCFPFGVQPRGRSSRCATRRRAAPEDLAALPRPIAGYVGGLHQWVDQDLLGGRRRDGCRT